MLHLRQTVPRAHVTPAQRSVEQLFGGEGG
jgi:hypothetical protein